jgi:hypothetical protein
VTAYISSNGTEISSADAAVIVLRPKFGGGLLAFIVGIGFADIVISGLNMRQPKRFALSPASSGAVQIESCDRGRLW